MDVGKFLRLQGAIKSSLDAIPVDQAAVAADAMLTTYERMRSEVRDAIPKEHHKEFDRLFPATIERPVNNPGGRLALIAGRFNSARSLLGSMAGWLDGYVQAARMQMEAEAYAQARVKEERGVGFKGPS